LSQTTIPFLFFKGVAIMAPKRASRAEEQRQRRAASKEGNPDSRAAQIEREMRLSFETAKSRLESGLKDLMPGSNAHVKVVTAIADLERAYRKERADRGLDAQRLGTAGPTGYHFVCHVGPSGGVSTEEVPAEKLAEVLRKRAEVDAARLAKANTPERQAMCAELDAEFGFDADGNDHSYDGVKKESDPNDE
jgi:hypothetical protein